MSYVDENDYIMRMIKEMVQVLASVIFGKNMWLLNGNRKINSVYQEMD